MIGAGGEGSKHLLSWGNDRSRQWVNIVTAFTELADMDANGSTSGARVFLCLRWLAVQTAQSTKNRP